MKHCIDFILIDRPEDDVKIFQFAAHDGGVTINGFRQEATLGHPVAYQADDIGSAGNQFLRQPGSEETRGAGNEDAPLGPETVYTQVFHGAFPSCQRCSRSCRSRIVSIGCQNPRCL